VKKQGGKNGEKLAKLCTRRGKGTKKRGMLGGKRVDPERSKDEEDGSLAFVRNSLHKKTHFAKTTWTKGGGYNSQGIVS